jgi:hypothetical protein
MKLKEIIIQMIAVAIAFAFPHIWNWIIVNLPWWFLDPESTLNLIVMLAITVVSWLLGIIGIKRLITQLRTQGFKADL